MSIEASRVLGVAAPAPQRSVAADAHGVVLPRARRPPVGGRADQRRQQPVRGGAVTQSAVAVVAPGPQRAVGGHGHRVLGADADAAPGSTEADLHRPELVVQGRAVPHLALVVVPPRPDGPVRSSAGARAHAGVDVDPVGGVADLHRRRPVLVAAIAEHAVPVLPPRPERSVVADGERVLSGRGHRSPAVVEAERGRPRLVRPISQLALAVRPPDPWGGLAAGTQHRQHGDQRGQPPAGRAPPRSCRRTRCKPVHVPLHLLSATPSVPSARGEQMRPRTTKPRPRPMSLPAGTRLGPRRVDRTSYGRVGVRPRRPVGTEPARNQTTLRSTSTLPRVAFE